MPRGPQSCWSRCLVILVASIVIAMLEACSGAPKPVYFPGYPIGFVERGVASWYGPGFHGNKTANGERYDMHQLTRGRVLDLSLAGAHALGMIGAGTDEIELRVVGYQGRTTDMGFLRVQVGSFSDQQNALNLLERVKPFYSGGRVQFVDLPEGRRYRVQIGQFSREAQAEDAVSHLESSLGLQAFVFRDDG